jgi:hypothetical protein
VIVPDLPRTTWTLRKQPEKGDFFAGISDKQDLKGVLCQHVRKPDRQAFHRVIIGYT